jgi:3-dehydroquinate synthetase
MSKEENMQEKAVVVTPEDCKAAFEFFDHFKVPKSTELEAALEAFKADQTVENQDRLKMALCQAIGFTEHKCFQDEMFAKIVTECQTKYYDMAFDKELEETLSKEKETSKENQ